MFSGFVTWESPIHDAEKSQSVFFISNKIPQYPSKLLHLVKKVVQIFLTE